MQVPPFELERFFAKHEFNAPHLLCCSDCESISLKDLLDLEPESRVQFEKLWLGYSDSAGHPKLRQIIATLYQTISKEEVLVHTGAEEAIFNFMNSCLSKGDKVLVHWPCYQSLAQIPQSIGCEVIRWEANPLKGWELDLNFLETALKNGTKLVVFNLPHNPTGYLMEKKTYLKAVELVNKSGAWVFSDEVYRGLEYDSSSTLPSAVDLCENAISLGVLSKSYGLAGLRIGWVATKNREIYRRMAEFKDYTTICNSAPGEFLAALALRHQKALLDRNRAIIQENLHSLDSFFAQYSRHFEWVRPKASCLAFPKLLNDLSADNFCSTLLRDTGVLLAPSTQFGFGNHHFRLGFGRKNLPEALSKLAEWVSEQDLDSPLIETPQT